MSLRGKAAVKEALRRAQADEPVPHGLSGLDVDVDERGLAALFHLVAPESWAPVPESARIRALDWLLDAGADGDAVTPLGSSALEEAISAGLEGVARRLVERGAVAHLDAALAVAFRVRRVGLARELLARGARMTAPLGAGLCLSDVVRGDLVTPRDIDVRYRASAEPQGARFSVRMFRLEPASAVSEPAVRMACTLLPRLGEVGVLGGDRFAPAASRVEVVDLQLRPEGSQVVEATATLRMRGVSPEGLALAFRGLVAGPAAAYPMSLRLEGELAPDGSPDSVLTPRAEAWFRDAALDPIRPYPELSLPVESKPKKKTLAVVRHAAQVGREVLRAIAPLEDRLLPRLGAVAFDAAAPGAAAVLDGKPADTQTELVLRTYGLGGETIGFDMALLRTLVLHAVAAVPGVTGLRWCDEPGAASADVAATPAPGPAPDKPRRGRKASSR